MTPRQTLFCLRLLTIVLWFSPAWAFSATWYIAPNGSDANSGSIAAPFATIMKAQTVAHSNDIVWLRGGTYFPTNISLFNSKGVPWNVINYMTNNGISYVAYSNELPVFDFSKVYFTPPTNRVTGFLINATNCIFRGFDIAGVPIIYTNTSMPPQSECIRVNFGYNCLFDRLRMHDGHGIGLYITDGISNLVRNCDAWNNTGVDKFSQGNIDGFGCHVTSTKDTGNMFYGCRAWYNSDDGYDLINCKAVAIFDHCWSFYNGFFTNGTGTGGNGNGFKCGGYGVAGNSYPIPPPRHTARFCLSVGNAANGFYANFHPDGLNFINNTAIRNAAAPDPGANADFNMVCVAPTNTARADQVPGFDHFMRNNIGLVRTDTNSISWLNTGACDVAYNFFTLPVTVTSNDFVSLDETLLTLPRQADGSLPYIAYAQLVHNSDLVDAGTNAGFAWAGSAPDLGAFEYGSQPPPTLAMSQAGTNSVLNGAGGAAGGTYYLVASDDLTLPLAQWTSVATNKFDTSGNCSITNSVLAGAAQEFFRIRLP